MKIMLITPFYLPSIGGVQYMLYNTCKRLPPEDIIVMRSLDPLDDKKVEHFDASQPYKIIENKYFNPTPNPRYDLNSSEKNEFAQRSIWNRLFLKSRIIRISYIFLSVISTLIAIKKNNIDTIWCGYSTIRMSIICLLAKYFWGIPYAFSVYAEEILLFHKNTSKYLFYETFFKYLGLKKSFKIFSVCNFSKEILIKAQIPTNKIIVLFSRVDLSNFKINQNQIDSIKKKLNIEGKKILLTLGNISKRKGVDTVLKIIPELIKNVPSLIYIVVGRLIGEEEIKLKKIIAENNIKDRVVFVGQVPNVSHYFHLCDVFCLATPNNQEGLPLTILEANACKKPVVGFDTGGIRDAIINGETGLLVKYGDIEGLKNALLKLLTNGTYARELGERGYKRVVKEFNWDGYARKVYATFKELRR